MQRRAGCRGWRKQSCCRGGRGTCRGGFGQRMMKAAEDGGGFFLATQVLNHYSILLISIALLISMVVCENLQLRVCRLSLLWFLLCITVYYFFSKLLLAFNHAHLASFPCEDSRQDYFKGWGYGTSLFGLQPGAFFPALLYCSRHLISQVTSYPTSWFFLTHIFPGFCLRLRWVLN